VTILLGQAILPTLLLTLGGTLVSVVVGVPLGVLAALNGGRGWIIWRASARCWASPYPYSCGACLLLLAFSLQWPLLPSAGAGDTPIDVARSLIMPSIATRFFRSAS